MGTILKVSYRSNKKGFITLILIYIISGILPFFVVQTSADFLDALIRISVGQSSITDSSIIIWHFVIVNTLVFIFNLLKSRFRSTFSIHLDLSLTRMIIDKVDRLEYYRIESSDDYNLIERVKSEKSNIQFGLFGLLDLTGIVLSLLSTLVYIFTLIQWIALVQAILFIPVIYLALQQGNENYSVMQKFAKVAQRQASYEQILVSREAASERKIFKYEDYVSSKWADTFDESSSIFLNFKKSSYTAVKKQSFFINIIFLIIISIILISAINGQTSIGDFTILSTQLLSLSSTITWSLYSQVQAISKAISYAHDLQNLMNLGERTAQQNIKKLYELSEEKTMLNLKVEDLTFTYPNNEEPTLQNMNFEISEKQSVAIVGSNGAGKTTLSKLLLGLFDNYSGKISINNVDIADISDKSEIFSVAFQDFAKYQLNIRDNINFGDNTKLTDEEINSSLDSMGVDLSGNRNLELGLDTKLGNIYESNNDLSGGEWQKLSLVRALAEPGQIFILDEPTAALDPSSEAAVYEDFLKIIGKKPSIIITHRLGAARLADEILVIDDGRVVEQGSHNELLAKKGQYADMYSAQRSWYT